MADPKLPNDESYCKICDEQGFFIVRTDVAVDVELKVVNGKQDWITFESIHGEFIKLPCDTITAFIYSNVETRNARRAFERVEKQRQENNT